MSPVPFWTAWATYCTAQPGMLVPVNSKTASSWSPWWLTVMFVNEIATAPGSGSLVLRPRPRPQAIAAAADPPTTRWLGRR